MVVKRIGVTVIPISKVSFGFASGGGEYSAGAADKPCRRVMRCPVDVRRALYSNVVTAGGSTKFKGFDKRLARDLKRLVNGRYESNVAAVREKLGSVEVSGKVMEVVVSGPKKREIASWLGGSFVASQVCEGVLCVE